MSIRQFIGASSALLLVWLGVTFFHEVPAGRYQITDGNTLDSRTKSEKAETTIVSAPNSKN